MSIILLNTNDAYLVITDLLTPEKRAQLARTVFGPLVLPHLEDIAERLAIVTRRGAPYAAELAEADQRHDIGLVVLDHICQIHELLGALPEYAELADTGRSIRRDLSMDRTYAGASYGEEAANALRNRPLLDQQADTLAAIPIAQGVTARDAAELFVGGGEQIGHFLRKRAEVLAEVQAARTETGSANLLHEARDLLTRARAGLEGEASMRSDLPAGFVARVFSVLDERITVAITRQVRGAAALDGAGLDGAVIEPLDLDPEVDRAEAAAEAPEAPAAEAPEAPDADAEAPRPPLRPLPDRA